jgi:hypothetical protein
MCDMHINASCLPTPKLHVSCRTCWSTCLTLHFLHVSPLVVLHMLPSYTFISLHWCTIIMVIMNEEEVVGSHIIDLSSTCSKMKNINNTEYLQCSQQRWWQMDQQQPLAWHLNWQLAAPPMKGMYAMSRSCEHQPSKNMPSILTFVVKPATLAQHKRDSILQGLFVQAK